jgi:hypothetical protein
MMEDIPDRCITQIISYIPRGTSRQVPPVLRLERLRPLSNSERTMNVSVDIQRITYKLTVPRQRAGQLSGPFMQYSASNSHCRVDRMMNKPACLEPTLSDSHSLIPGDSPLPSYSHIHIPTLLTRSHHPLSL